MKGGKYDQGIWHFVEGLSDYGKSRTQHLDELGLRWEDNIKVDCNEYNNWIRTCFICF